MGQEDPLEKEMATHSSILTWKSPWMEEPGRLQSMGSQRVRHSWATSLSLSDAGKDRGQKEKRGSEDEMFGWHHQCNEHEPRQTPGNGEGQEGLAVHGAAKSQTQSGNRTTTTNTYNHHLRQETALSVLLTVLYVLGWWQYFLFLQW